MDPYLYDLYINTSVEGMNLIYIKLIFTSLLAKLKH